MLPYTRGGKKSVNERESKNHQCTHFTTQTVQRITGGRSVLLPSRAAAGLVWLFSAVYVVKWLGVFFFFFLRSYVHCFTNAQTACPGDKVGLYAK